MLLGAIDDATSEILALQFRPAEDVHGYTTLFRELFTRDGLPLAVYDDRLNLLVRNDAHWSVDEQLPLRRVVARDNTVRLGPRLVHLRGPRSYAGLTVDVRELLDGRLVVLHDDEIRGTANRRGRACSSSPAALPADRRPRRSTAPPALPRRLPRLAPKTHTGRLPLPTHPWVRAHDHEIRLQELRTGRTSSRSSDGGLNH